MGLLDKAFKRSSKNDEPSGRKEYRGRGKGSALAKQYEANGRADEGLDEDFIVADEATPDSAFGGDDDFDFFGEKQKEYEKSMEAYADIPDLQVKDKKVQDVLEVMEIPATFAIEEDLFMPEDLANVVFDIQAPFGFEQGQVVTFVEKTRASINRYVELLRLRNDHVAKLATVIDKLQIDANNLRIQLQVKSGLDSMPDAEEDYEIKYMEAQLTIRRLEDELRAAGASDADLSSQERLHYQAVQDQLAVLSREKEELDDEYRILYEEYERLSKLEESGKFEEIDTDELLAFEPGSSEGLPMLDSVSLPNVDDAQGLPTIDYSVTLPEDLSGLPAPVAPKQSSSNSPFYEIDEPLYGEAEEGVFIPYDENESQVDEVEVSDLLDMPLDLEEEDDEELDKMMREW